MKWIVFACLGVGLASALVGGVFQAFSDFVMRGLILAEPAGGIESMQQLNRTVFRSAFLTMFLALVPITIGLSVYAGLRLDGATRTLIIAGSVVYLLTVFVTTVVGNVPMNERLDAMVHTSAEAATYWVTYGRVWTLWNHVRTLGSIAAAVLFLLAAVYD